MLVWTREMQFWRPRLKNFDRKPGIFHSMSGNDSNFLFLFQKLLFAQNDPQET